ncbi:MAG: hypothetical protein HY691_20445 [Chloroflexi bacterium]|nr:hypothetical protein [Chloroflexota bacterium]
MRFDAQRLAADARDVLVAAGVPPVVDDLVRNLLSGPDGRVWTPPEPKLNQLWSDLPNDLGYDSIVADNQRRLERQAQRLLAQGLVDHPYGQGVAEILRQQLDGLGTQIETLRKRLPPLPMVGTPDAPPRVMHSIIDLIMRRAGSSTTEPAADPFTEILRTAAQVKAAYERAKLQSLARALAAADELRAKLTQFVDQLARRRATIKALAGAASALAHQQADEAVERLAMLHEDLPPQTHRHLVAVLAAQDRDVARQIGLEGVVAALTAESPDEETSPVTAAQVVAAVRQQTEQDAVVSDDISQVVGRLGALRGDDPRAAFRRAVAYLAGPAFHRAPFQPTTTEGTLALFQIVAPGAMPPLALDGGEMDVARFSDERPDHLGLLQIRGNLGLDQIEAFGSARARLAIAEQEKAFRLFGRPGEPPLPGASASGSGGGVDPAGPARGDLTSGAAAAASAAAASPVAASGATATPGEPPRGAEELLPQGAFAAWSADQADGHHALPAAVQD